MSRRSPDGSPPTLTDEDPDRVPAREREGSHPPRLAGPGEQQDGEQHLAGGSLSRVLPDGTVVSGARGGP